MKIFTLSADSACLQSDSDVAKRFVWYGESVDRFTVLVAASHKTEVLLSPRVSVYSVKKQSKFITFFLLYSQAKRLLQQDQYQVITTQDHYFLGFLSWLLAKQFRLGLEVQVHGWEKGSGMRNFLAKFILPKAQSVRVVSDKLKEKVVAEYRVDPEKITSVPIYTQDRSIGFVRSFAQTKKPFIFLTVGRLVEVKNISLQISAMAAVVKKFPDTELWIVGDGPERERLEKKIQQHRLQSCIKLFGWKTPKELDDLYRQADCFLLTSWNEGWGRVIIEAGSFSLPVIQTNVGVAEQLVRSYENGIVIPVNDETMLRESMEKILIDPVLRQTLGTSLRESVLQLPNLSSTLELYSESWQRAAKMRVG